MIDLPSPNHEPRPADQPVDMLVIHYTGMRDAQAALQRLCDPAAKVSAHYLIDERGAVCRMVPEERRAWHAGVASWRGHGNVNDRSIGIELANPGHEFGYVPFTAAQMAALIRLARGILGRHPIPPRNVVGHSDIAPARKQDPGELFDWRTLAEAGIGLWPAAAALHRPRRRRPAAEAVEMLKVIGYDGSLSDTDAATVVAAFQRRYRPRRVDGRIDAETFARIEDVFSLLA